MGKVVDITSKINEYEIHFIMGIVVLCAGVDIQIGDDNIYYIVDSKGKANFSSPIENVLYIIKK